MLTEVVCVVVHGMVYSVFFEVNITVGSKAGGVDRGGVCCGSWYGLQCML